MTTLTLKPLLTFAEAQASAACYECGALSARCSFCGESASQHRLECGVLRQGDYVCDATGIGEFYRAEPWMIAHDRETGGVQLECYCPPCERVREAAISAWEGAAARARGEDC